MPLRASADYIRGMRERRREEVEKEGGSTEMTDDTYMAIS
jgi:hypothetical protein